MRPAEDILRHLIAECGKPLHLPAGDNQIAAHLAKETRLSKGTISGILNGHTNRLSENTRNKLADYFNRVAVPKIHPAWLSSTSLAEFNAVRAGLSAIPIRMPPDYQQKVSSVQRWLCGVHIVYRYSLDRISTGEIAREVVHIWNDGTFLQFRMSFINQGGGDIFFFDGPVLLVGRSVILFGTNIGRIHEPGREYDRARVIVLDHDNGGIDTRDCKIGLMTSTRPRRDHAPCTASTMLVRAQWSAESHFEELVKTATDILPLNDLISSDFGIENSPFIKLFLDNRPHGCQLEPDMQQYTQPSLGREPERVLRLDTERFASTMHLRLPGILENDAICAPFKENWLARMRNVRSESPPNKSPA
jgi:transcriptional regulator with XRE-family HTH domain